MQILRQTARNPGPLRDRALLGFFQMLARFPEGLGATQILWIDCSARKHISSNTNRSPCVLPISSINIPKSATASSGARSGARAARRRHSYELRCAVGTMQVVDKEDVLGARTKTRYVLKRRGRPLIFAAIRMLMTRPICFFARVKSCLASMSRRAERPLPVHLVYLAEACRILPWLREEGVDHVHAHFGTNSAEVAMLVNVLGGPRWSFTVHGPEEFDKAPSIGLAEKIRRAEFVVAVSSFGRSQLYRLVEHHVWPKVHVVHCGLDTAFMTVSSPLYRRPTPRLRRSAVRAKRTASLD